MYPSLRLLAQHQRTPLIKFLGKRSFPKPTPSSTPSTPSPNEVPHPHPASPSHDLPSSFAAYRSNAQQHGPLARQTPQESSASSAPPSASSPSSPSKPPSQSVPTSRAYGAIGGHSGHSLGSVTPGHGTVMDRTELPARFWGLRWTEEEIEGVELGGANLKVGWGGS